MKNFPECCKAPHMTILAKRVYLESLVQKIVKLEIYILSWKELFELRKDEFSWKGTMLEKITVKVRKSIFNL